MVEAEVCGGWSTGGSGGGCATVEEGGRREAESRPSKPRKVPGVFGHKIHHPVVPCAFHRGFGSPWPGSEHLFLSITPESIVRGASFDPKNLPHILCSSPCNPVLTPISEPNRTWVGHQCSRTYPDDEETHSDSGPPGPFLHPVRDPPFPALPPTSPGARMLPRGPPGLLPPPRVPGRHPSLLAEPLVQGCAVL